MKPGPTARALLALALALSAPAVPAQSQMAENRASCAAFEAADRRLNAAYRKVLAAKRADARFVVRFRAAQRAWLAFRDAEIEAVFPARDKRLAYGSAFPMCDCDVRAEITTQRAARLEGWLSAPEGDVCAGSRAAAGAG